MAKLPNHDLTLITFVHEVQLSEAIRKQYRTVTVDYQEELLINLLTHFPGILICRYTEKVFEILTKIQFYTYYPIGVIIIEPNSKKNIQKKILQMGVDLMLPDDDDDMIRLGVEGLWRKYRRIAHHGSSVLPAEDFAENPQSENFSFLQKVCQLVEQNLSNLQLGVEFLCDELGLSSTHLYRKLKSVTHISANELIKRIRIHRAAAMLKTRRSNVSEIMHEVGFTSHSYFSKCFRKIYKVTPKTYQQQSIVNTGSQLLTTRYHRY